MNVIVINPPLVQLNTVYPAGAYLSAYFRQQNCNVVWHDLSIRLFYSIFSRQGLTKLFKHSSQNAIKLADNALSNGDEATSFNLRRYVATQQSWINWIDFITESLRGGGQEKAHQFLYSPYAPRGNRMENYLADISSQNREPNVDDIRFLCTLALADLADYITAVFDPNFSLIRYAEALTVNESSFAQIENQIDSPVMEHFYKPVLEEVFGGESLPLAPTASGVFRYPFQRGQKFFYRVAPATPPKLCKKLTNTYYYIWIIFLY